MKPLAVKAIHDDHGHVTLAGPTAIAWFRLAPVRWNWRPDSEREAMIVAFGQRLAALTESRVHWRVTTRPMSPDGCRSRMDAATGSPLPGFAAHLDRCTAKLASLNLADKEAYMGVELARPTARFASLLGSGGRHLEGLALSARLTELDAIMSAAGLDGRRATRGEVEWLIHRSVALGAPAPQGSTDLEAAGDRAEWTCEPYGRTVQVATDVSITDRVTRHVAVVTIGRMAEASLHDPWLAKLDRLPFGYEVAATLNVLADAEVVSAVRRTLLRIRSQVVHFGEHKIDPPHALAQQRARALEIEAEIEAGMGDLSTRVDGWFRIAVAADTEAEALARAAKVADLLNPRIETARPYGQYAAAREFIPGEPLSSVAYRRRMPVTTAAAAMPAVTATVGHRSGMYLGYTVGAGGKHAVFWDLHRSMEVRERSGLTLIAGTLGSGKSTVLALATYHAALAGVRCMVLDPSSRLSRLTELPELCEHSQHIDLLNAAPGTLNPWRIIPPPERGQYDTDIEFDHAVRMVEAERQALCADVLTMLLPAVLAEQADTLIALTAAAGSVSGPDASPRQAIRALRDGGFADGDNDMIRHSRRLASFLEAKADMPAAQLIFPSGDAGLDYDGGSDARLTVITMKGLSIPKEGSARREWTTDEQMSLPLLHLAAWKAARAMYRGDRHERKLLVVDEAHALTRVSAGRGLLNSAARDSRAWNTRLLSASHSVSDWATAELSNLIDSVLVGRTEDTAQDAAAQRAALEVLRVPTGVGYEKVLGGLSQHTRGAEGRSGSREFVFADGEGGIERIVIDLSALSADVREKIDTTAKPRAAASKPVSSNGKRPAQVRT